jgi:hypothetical protein
MGRHDGEPPRRAVRVDRVLRECAGVATFVGAALIRSATGWRVASSTMETYAYAADLVPMEPPR